MPYDISSLKILIFYDFIVTNASLFVNIFLVFSTWVRLGKIHLREDVFTYKQVIINNM